MNIDNSADERLNPANGASSENEAFLRLYSKHQRDLFKFIFTLVPNHADADDILQDSSVILWQKFGEFSIGTNFFHWASRVAYNKVRDFRKKAARNRLRFWTDDLIDAIAETQFAERESLVQQRDLLVGCMRELAPNDRELVRQYFSKRLTIKAVAEFIGRPSNTVYKALNRIRKTLMDCVVRAQQRGNQARRQL